LTPITVAKFGGSALGADGVLIPKVIERIAEMKKESKIVAVFSAPLTEYDGKVVSMTDVALKVGRSYASSVPLEIEPLREVYERIASKYQIGRAHV